MRDRESGHDFEQPLERTAEQEQADHKKDMIRSDENVMHTFTDELFDHRADSLRLAHDVMESGGLRIENSLILQRLALINIQKCFVARRRKITRSAQ